MKDINEIKKTLKEVDKSKYPELHNYTNELSHGFNPNRYIFMIGSLG